MRGKDDEKKSAEKKLMEMDCYPEYKHHVHPNHQHYNNNVAANHSYYPGNYGPTSMRYTHAHSYPEGAQQQNWIDGYSRYNHAQHHLNHHGNYSSSFNGHYGAMRENYHPNSEGSGQFYYQNGHQTSASYYGNHSYESYRNAASSSYHYHYGAGAATGAYHQPTTQPTQYYPSYNGPTEQFNNRYYPTPPPSTPPTSSERDPYSLTHSGDGSLTSYAPTMESESSEKLNNERLSNDCEKGSTVDPLLSSPSSSSPIVKQSTEVAESVEMERKPEVQQTEMENSPHDSVTLNESEKFTKENANEAVKVEGCLDSEEKEQKASKHENHHHHQSPSLFHENSERNQHSCNENLTKVVSGSSVNSQESPMENSIATGK